MLRAGFAKVDITPTVDSRPRGSHQPRMMVGVHDPLLATACVIDDGKTRLAIVGVDVGVIQRSTFLIACERIERKTGIPASHIIASASHTHTGGACLSLFHAVADEDYANVVANGIADAVAAAHRATKPVAMGSASATVSGIHFNRRFILRDGRQATHPGKMHPEIVKPAGPIDDRVSAILFRDPATDRPAGAIVHFGCHSTVVEDSNEYSADYAHYFREHLRKSLGPIDVVFLLGACGDVTQIDNQSPVVEKGHAHADMMGRMLAGAALDALKLATFSDRVDLGVASETVAVAIRTGDVSPPPTIGLGAGDFWEPLFARERDLVAAIRSKTPLVDLHLTAMRLGDVAIVTSGAELFAQPALDIQKASPFEKTWTVTLANEYVGYVPTAEAHAAGGYETRTARSSFLVPEAAGLIVSHSLKAIRAVGPK